MRFIIFALIILLSGCSTAKDFICKDVLVQEERKLTVDPRYLQECSALSKLQTTANFNEVLAVTAENAILYSDCKNRQSDSIRLIKQLGNIE